MEIHGDLPPEGAVERAVGASREGEPGRILKVLYLDEQGQPTGEWASQQIVESQWTGQNTAGLQEPPLSMEQLVYLAESHPVHSAALEQKAADICGKGWSWTETEDGDDEADDEARRDIEDWFQSLAPDDEDIQGIIHSVWLDVETTGWGLLEVVRDPNGTARRVYHVPGHTVRAHRDGFRLCQQRDSRKVWFRRWGATDVRDEPVEVDTHTGAIKNVRDPANDLFVIKRPSRRSSWYGIPGYVSAIGWITLALAARDDNLYFFTNRREPRWAIVLSNLSNDPSLEEELRRAFVVDLRQPYRNIFIPIKGPGEIKFNKLTDNRMEGSFEQLSERADKAIVVAHRVPADRLANSSVGPLGGNSAKAINRIYKEGVVVPGQELLNVRLNRFIAVEYARSLVGTEANPRELPPIPFALHLDDLDIETDREELDLTVLAFQADLITLREARRRIKMGPLMNGMEEDGESPYNDLLYTQLPGVKGGGGGGGAPVLEARDDVALALLDADVRELLHQGHEVNARLAEMACAIDSPQP